MIEAPAASSPTRGILPTTAHILSNVISPPVVSAVFGFLIAWKEHPPLRAAMLGVVNGLIMCMLPMAVVIYLWRTGRIHDLHMSQSPQHRRLPYLTAFLGALIACMLFTLRGDSPLLRAMAACSALSLAALWLVNYFWLISNHAATITHAAVFGTYAFGAAAGLWSLPLVAVVIWSRWLLRKHTLPQLAAGLMVGAAPVILLAQLGWLQL
ncbi:MAG: hypothetical protein GX495_13030 [Chloroflexi bacterium]|jgi:hypothetical protein|nr:hypothetical protein [Chloroflexota bacterium]